MRDANAQRVNNMIPIGTMQQPSKPHVRHAETWGALGAVQEAYNGSV
jgi:hypothetical protein